jgi:hypothetical protein
MEKKSNDQKNSSDERLYTSQELEKIVEARLKRERLHNDSYMKVRESLALLRKEDAFKDLSNAKIAQKLSEIAQKLSSDETPDNDKDPVTVPDVQTSFEKAGAEENGNEKERRVNEIKQFISVYGEDTLEKLMEDKLFTSFCKRHSGDLLTLYEDYTIFLSQLANANSAVNARAAQRGFASTGFSGYAAGTPDYASLLTENQKKIASAAGMSYRQYSELLAQIPTKKVGK